MGNFWTWFWLAVFWALREVLGFMGDKDSEQECSQHPQGWNPVHKNLFSSTQIFGSYIRALSSQNPVCTIMLVEPSYGGGGEKELFGQPNKSSEYTEIPFYFQIHI